jgi:hypothetical protein
MKNAKWLVCVWMMGMGLVPLMAECDSNEQGRCGHSIVNLLDINADVIGDFFQVSGSDVIIECPAGARLPFTLNVKGEFLVLEYENEPSVYVNVLRTCYLRNLGEQKFQFSSDLENWQDFFEFFTGELTVFVEARENAGPISGIELQLNRRAQ